MRHMMFSLITMLHVVNSYYSFGKISLEISFIYVLYFFYKVFIMHFLKIKNYFG
jgi:hypothetical protein